jgi:hypothetical protein
MTLLIRLTNDLFINFETRATAFASLYGSGSPCLALLEIVSNSVREKSTSSTIRHIFIKKEQFSLIYSKIANFRVNIHMCSYSDNYFCFHIHSVTVIDRCASLL